MKLDLAIRRSGKTTRAVSWLKEKPFERILVVATEQERNRLISELRPFFLSQERINYAKVLRKQDPSLTFADAMEQAERFPSILALLPIYTWYSVMSEDALLGMCRKEIWIDDADRLLGSLFPAHRLVGMSMNSENVEIT